MVNTNFRKLPSGVVINTDKGALIQARKRKKALIEKDKKIQDLEERLKFLESLVEKAIIKE